MSQSRNGPVWGLLAAAAAVAAAATTTQLGFLPVGSSLPLDTVLNNPGVLLHLVERDSLLRVENK